MKSLYERLSSNVESVKKSAFAELEREAGKLGLQTKDLYFKMVQHVEKRAVAAKEAVAKGERHSQLDWTGVFSPVAKDQGAGVGLPSGSLEGSSAGTPGTGAAKKPKEDEDTVDARKGGNPRLVVDDEDEDESATKDADAMYDDDADDKKSATRWNQDGSARKMKGHGAIDKSKVRRGVSFKSVVMGDSREFPLESQEQARQPRGADTTQDALGRSYGSEVAARIAGAFSGVNEVEDSQVPNAGHAAYEFEGTTQDI